MGLSDSRFAFSRESDLARSAGRRYTPATSTPMTSIAANVILFLCSEAGRNVSGQSLGVCGNVEVI